MRLPTWKVVVSSCGRPWSVPFLWLFCLLIGFTCGFRIYWWVLFRIYQSSTMLLRWRSSAVRYMSHWVIGRSIFNDGVCLFYCLRFERRSCLGWGGTVLPPCQLSIHSFVCFWCGWGLILTGLSWDGPLASPARTFACCHRLYLWMAGDLGLADASPVYYV